ncbi:MAG: ClpXP protease specificity-enhancing factor [Lautropia sp.]|nr:ClpXP protease specificity-enhancing factor [Lautropia sp.]
MAETSTKPYMIRAIYEWCCDNAYTPYLAVKVDGRTRVPVQHVRNGEIVLNISPLATHAAQLGNDLIEFQARFNGVPEYVSVPVGNVLAIYARETGSGMAFSPSLDGADDGALDDENSELPVTTDGASNPPSEPPATGGGEVLAFNRAPARKPALKVAEPAPSAPSSSEPASSSASPTVAAPTPSPAAKGASKAVRPKPATGKGPSGQNGADGSGPDDTPPSGGTSKPRLVRVK